MNKSRKGFLTAGSILTIVSSAFCVLGALFMFLVGAYVSEEFLKETYMQDTEYTYTETFDGDYYFTTIEDGEEIKITEDDIELIADIASMMCSVIGVVALGISAAKIALAIRVLIMNSKNKYAKGSIIALIVLSFLNSNIIEAVLFIVAMCQKDVVNPEIKTEEQPEQLVITETIE